jgi:prepilin-type N-terminal cleavage/methylation domain-containing protein/prepilin-type processing-associated H-X9-DG protein
MKISQSNRGFTLIELLVTITIIVVLAALSFVGITRAREAAHRSGSAANLRQIGVTMIAFSADNNGFLPATRKSNGTFWPELVWSSLPSPQVYLRPGTRKQPINPSKNDGDGYFALPDNAASTPEKQPIRWNYVINGGASTLPFSETAETADLPGTLARGLSRPLIQIEDPSRTIMFADGNGAFWINGEAKTNSNRIYKWKNGKSNILWFDGSVQMLSPKELRPEHFTAKK